MSGSAKAVVEFGREAQTLNLSAGRFPSIRLTVATFRRGDEPLHNSLVQTLRQWGIEHRFIQEERRFDSAVLPQLRRLVESTNADVVWTNSVKSHFLARLAGLHRDRPWLAFHHGYTSTDAKMLAYNQLDRWSLRKADRVMTVCRPFERQLMAMGVSQSRIRVQHMPVRPFEAPDSAQLSDVRAAFGIPPQVPVILSVGRLSREKGHADLLQAASLLQKQLPSSDFRLVLVGDGPELASLTKAVPILGLSGQTIFAGQQLDVRPFYALADVFVLPSHSEGSPNVLLEALAAGLPVVATAVGGIPEMVAEGKEALLVPPSQPAAMADAVARVLADAGLRSDLTQAAPNVVGRHSPERYFTSVYSELTSLSHLAAKDSSRG